MYFGFMFVPISLALVRCNTVWYLSPIQSLLIVIAAHMPEFKMLRQSFQNKTQSNTQTTATYFFSFLQKKA